MLLDRGAKNVIATLGERGAMLANAEHEGTVVSTTKASKALTLLPLPLLPMPPLSPLLLLLLPLPLLLLLMLLLLPLLPEPIGSPADRSADLC